MPLLLLVLACQPLRPLPDAALPPDTLLLREWFAPPGAERTLGRRERIDADGCWTQAPNSLLVVQDPALVGAIAAPLWLNGRFDDAPWFCLDEGQRRRLEDALRTLPPGTSDQVKASGVVERWTAVVDGRPVGVAFPLERPDASVVLAQQTLWSLASEGAWANTPEEDLSR